ncbi:MAG: serine hydrolase domain-containing protein [Sphingomonas sp.]|uniref:serine hydrolase domain-containing protein n=1 Tax=Sphingomonas sp. TaxID=28214 RepID=UPI003F7EDD73
MSDGSAVAKLDPKQIDALFAGIDQTHLPGVAVAVAIDGLPVYRKGFGLANMELPVALGPSIRMRIGSTTKHFVCLAYLLLCEEGRCGIDDEIGTHIPELHDASRHVTMREVMGHTSGIRDVYTISMMFHGTGRPVTDNDLLAYYTTIDDVDFASGTHWSYNNGAYMLLGIAVERIAGEPLADVLRKRIFEPVGMTDTMLRPWDSDFVPNSATLHMIDRQGRYTRDYMGMELSAAGGMVSTMDDMLRWLKHMDAPIVGTAETWALMKEPNRLANGTSTGYGLGLISDSYRGVRTLSHSGGVLGGNSQMIRVPSAGLDISIAANRMDLNSLDLANKIIDACIDGLDPLPEASKIEPRDAIYLSTSSGSVIEFAAKDDLQLVGTDGTPGIPMAPDAQGVLHLPAFMSFMKQSIAPGESGIRLNDFGNESELGEVERIPDATLGAFAGTYENDALDLRVLVANDAEGPRLNSAGRHGSAQFKLEPICARRWKAVTLGSFAMLNFLMTFDADGDGATARAPRMANIRFRRVASA